MKRFYRIAAAALLIVIMAAPVWCAEMKGPFAYATVLEYRFDPVPDGAEVSYTFMIQNRGNETLKIDKVKTS